MGMDVATFVVAAVAAVGAVATALATSGLLRHARRRTGWDVGDLRRSFYDDVTGNQQLPHPDRMRSRLQHADLSDDQIEFVVSYRERRDELLLSGRGDGELRQAIKEAAREQGHSPWSDDANDLHDQLRRILLDSDS